MTFTVAGIYDNQFPQSDDNAYITHDRGGEAAAGQPGRATAIYVRTRRGTSVSQEVAGSPRCAAA